jgi:hypothetical protein
MSLGNDNAGKKDPTPTILSLSLSLFLFSLSLLAIVCVRASVTIVLSFPLLINTHKHKQRPLSVFLFCNLSYLTFYLCFKLHTTIVRILRLHSLEQTRSTFFQFNHCQDFTRIAKIQDLNVLSTLR